MLKLKFNKKQYQVQGFFGLLATILAVPAIVVGVAVALITAVVVVAMLIPSIIIGMPTAKRLPKEDG